MWQEGIFNLATIHIVRNISNYNNKLLVSVINSDDIFNLLANAEFGVW